jgi:gliding motility-associated-like protein
VIHTYNSKGPFIVSLTVTTAGGCEVTKTDTIDFTPKLEVIASQKLFCGASSGAVSFTYNPKYTTPINPISHLWTFGDGNTSTLKNPTYTYTTEGTFIAKLALTYAGGCVIEGWDTIKVYTYPVPNFITNLRDVCVRTNVQFINLCQNCDSAIWDFGDKIVTPIKLPMPLNVNVSHAYWNNPEGIEKLTDTFDIKLRVFNGPCFKDTIFVNHIRVRAPLAYTKPVTLYCDTPANAVFTDISKYQNPRDSVSRLWVFSDPFSETVGGLPCIVNAQSGINIGRNCNQSVDSITAHTYKRLGTYNAYLRTYSKTTGCTDSFQFQIKVRPKYNLKFISSLDTGCAPLALTFKDTTRTSVKWKWEFGDPAYRPADTAISKDTAWKYNRPGNYTVKLKGTDTSGCEQTTTKQIVVRGPLANFGVVGKLCPPDTTNFLDLTVKTSRIQKWKWTFGDPGSGAQNDTSNQASTKHKFSKVGNFVVSLTVVDSEQCVNTIAKLIPYGPPKPDFLIDKNIICKNMGVGFTNNTPGSNTYQWFFGDATTSTAKSPTHIYADTGTFLVKLIAKRTDGCSDSLSHLSVRVVKPKVDFTADNMNAFCPPFTVRFNDSVTTDIIEWKWDFGDSSYSSVANPIKTYNKPGKYTVKLIAKSAGGCEDSITYADYIKVGGPVGSFTFNPRKGCIPMGAGFKASTVGAATHTWDFGDGSVMTTIADTSYHTYTASGTFKPVLILTDSNNCVIPYSSPDSVFLLPGSVADFGASDTTICIGGNVLFLDKSRTPAGVNIVSRLWKFGDLSTATINPVGHIYTTSGSFDVSLAITDDRGCTDTLVKPSYIQSTLQPIVTASLDTSVCAGASAQLNASGGIVYRWSPTTGLSDATISNPVATPLITTKYKVAAKGAGNCDTAYAFVTVTINTLPTVNAGRDTFLCKGASVKLNATSSGNTYAWYPSLGLTDTSLVDPVATIQNDMQYYVQVTDANFCVNTDSVEVDVVEPPVALVTGPQQVCYGAVIKLSTTDADDYEWSSGETTREIIASIKEDTSYWVIPFIKGCEGIPDTINIEISGDVIEADFMTTSDTLFSDKAIPFTNTSKGGASYVWDFMWGETQAGKTSVEKNPRYEYKRYGTYTIRLIATSDIGCRDTVYKTLTIINNDVLIPNAFSPNGDNLNDVFIFVASDSVKSFEFSIYSRWGQQIFKTNIEGQGWDGSCEGAPAQQDVYVYMFEGIVNKKNVVLSGTVTLLR